MKRALAPLHRRLRSWARSGIGPNWGDWVLPVPVFMVPVASFLTHFGISLLSPSALLSLALFGAVGLAAGAAIAVRPSILRPIVVALALVFLVDAQFNLLRCAHVLFGSLVDEGSNPGWLVFPMTFALVLAVGGLTAVGRDILTRVGAVVFLTALLATVVLPQSGDPVGARPMPQPPGPDAGDAPALAKSSRAPPPIIHIVSDEHIGIAGIPSDVPGAEEVRGALMDFYVDNGFRLYGRAFSHYPLTEDSLSYMFNGAVGARHRRFISDNDGQMSLSENAWFGTLARRGYRFRIYQTSHIDFCGTVEAAQDLCLTYHRSGLGAFSRADMPVLAKTQGLLENFLARSFIYGLIADRVLQRRAADETFTERSADLLWSWKPTVFVPLGSLEVVDRLVDDLRSVRRGTVYFAHLMVSHRGFVLDADCRVRADTRTWFDHPRAAPDESGRFPAGTRIPSYRAYFEQLHCNQRQLARLLAALDEAGADDDTMVIIQGDHGSRISAAAIVPGPDIHLTEDDQRDLFSTLFAIRAPDMPGGYDDDVRSIQGLFAELAMRRPLADEPRLVYLRPGEETDMLQHPFTALD